MKCATVLVGILVVTLLSNASEAAPGKIPVKAIKSAGEAIGKGLRAINIASTVHDVVKAFQPRPRKHRKNKG